MNPAFSFREVSFTYPGQLRPALVSVTLDVPAGAFVLVTGATGSGKSTLLRAIDGLVPHFTGGSFEGTVVVGGRDTRDHPPRRLSDIVAFVPQDPGASFVLDRVDEELAFAMENLGVGAKEMEARIDAFAELLDIGPLLGRSVRELSGGERQRVAIAAALTPGARVLVLDEPTSQLDPHAADDVLETLRRLVRETGQTVVVAEHRLERVVSFADIALGCDAGRVFTGSVLQVLEATRSGPPVTRVARALGWDPLPITVSDAKIQAGRHELPPPDLPRETGARPVLVATGLSVDYGAEPVLEDLSLEVRAGRLHALVGPNGAGKTTLLRALTGVETVRTGTVRFDGRAPRTGRDVALCPQASDDILFNDSVRKEIQATLRQLDDPPDVDGLLEGWGLSAFAERHPRDLSAGQRLLVAIAAVAATGAPVLLLDEPTRGLDHPTKERLIHMLRLWTAQGRAVLFATHDVELVASAADRVTRLEQGRVIAEGDPASVLSNAAPHSQPQMTQVFGPRWLTPQQVVDAHAARLVGRS